MAVPWDQKHTLPECDLLTECLLNSISDSFHLLQPENGPQEVLLVSGRNNS